MKGRIDRLVVENYRGASSRLELDFDKNKPVALVFGENGTGKTTIVDALDAVGNSSHGSLGDKSSTRARDHLPTIGMKPSDVRIEVIAGSNSWKATLAGDLLTTSPQPPPIIRILRRSQLQALIEAQPAKRYDELRSFIDVDKVERAENSLKDAASGAKSELDSAVKRRVEADSQLQKVWEAEGKLGTTPIAWAATAAAKDTKTLESDVQRLRQSQALITKAESSLAEWQQAGAVVLQSAGEAQKVQMEVESLPGIAAQQTIDMVRILKEVSDHLQHGAHPDECPVCKQGISVDALKADIHARLADFQQYAEIQSRRDTAVRKVDISNQIVEPKLRTMVAQARQLFAIVKMGEVKLVVESGIKQADYPELGNPKSDDLAAALEAAKLIGEMSVLKQLMSDEETTTAKQSGLINSGSSWKRVGKFHPPNRLQAAW